MATKAQVSAPASAFRASTSVARAASAVPLDTGGVLDLHERDDVGVQPVDRRDDLVLLALEVWPRPRRRAGRCRRSCSP